MSGKVKVAQTKKRTVRKTSGKTSGKVSGGSRKKTAVKLDGKAVALAVAFILLFCAAVLLFACIKVSSGNAQAPSSEVNAPVVKDETPVQPDLKKEDPLPVDSGSGKNQAESLPPENPPVETVPEEKTDAEKKSSGTFSFPPAKNAAKICFVIDDAGLNVENVRRYASLPFPITIAVLPKLSQSAECASLVKSYGKELILHQPMQAHDYSSGTTPDPGPGAILPDMEPGTVSSVMDSNFLEISGAKGFNNHEGSLITESREIMETVLSFAKDRGIYFLDSRTTASSSVPEIASEKGLPYIARFAPFLDNAVDRDQMLEQIRKGLEVANRDGYAVMIGHVDKSVEILPALLEEVYAELVECGYVLTTPSSLDLN